jgi:curved DNA-binding protein CbpA
MRESKESYYEILGVSERCTKEDIKHAYIELCKNYHPDKLPPDTPEGARKFISERMALINEAYNVLKDENKRNQYDGKINLQVANTNYKTYRTSTSTNEKDVNELFNQSILENAQRELEYEENQFERDLRSTITTIEKKYSQHLRTIKTHIPGSTDVNDSSTRLEKSIGYGFAAFIALWLVPLGGFISFLGWISLITFGILLINAASSPVYRSDYVKEVKAAKAKRDQGLLRFKNGINAKINYFKRIPIDSINYEFIKELLPRDRLLLIKALRQREHID